MCSDNKIGVYYKEEASYNAMHEFRHDDRIYGLRVYSSKGGKLDKENYHDDFIQEGYQFGLTTLNNYVEYLLMNYIPSLENYFNVDQDSFMTKIEEIDFDWFDYSKVTSFKNAFKGMTGLKRIKFKSNWRNCKNQTSPLNTTPKPKVLF